MTKPPARSPRRSASSAEGAPARAAAEEIDRLIESLGDWRGETLATARAAIRGADPGVVETWKWRGSPVWEKGGVLCVGNAHRNKVKLTFQDGARLPDPHGLFNAGLGGGKWRAIDLYEGDAVRREPLRELVRAAVAVKMGKREASAVRQGRE